MFLLTPCLGRGNYRAMSISACLIGPPFSLVGETLMSGQQVTVEAVFGNGADEFQVKAYQWYLNGILVVGKIEKVFSTNLACGSYTIALRILTAQGWSSAKSLAFHTCVSFSISGPDSVAEGETASYQVQYTLNDGTVLDVTNEYTFSSNAGSFYGNVFTAVANSVHNDTRQGTVTAVKSGGGTLTKAIAIVDKTPVALVSIALNGPSSVDEGATASYQVIASYSDGTTQDLSSQYVFTSGEGSFVGTILTVPSNSTQNDSRQTTITASKPGQGYITRSITIVNTTTSANTPLGVLVVDLFNNTSLNVLGFIADSEVVESQVPAYTGSNIIPSDALTASDALILASDVVLESALSWRFEFNIEKLVSSYPQKSQFTFIIRGRGSAITPLHGVYGAKSNGTTMTLTGTEGSYVPGTSGGTNVGEATTFHSPIVGGANGDYSMGVLPPIITLVYNVASKQITATVPPSNQ